jgi:RNA recognition motif-containing protein
MSQQIFSVFVGDLSIFCNESHIKLAFAKFGEIMAVRIAFDEESHKQLPYGFVDFATTESANEAMTSMDGTILCGRRIR